VLISTGVGFHFRTLITRVGKLELRVPQDRTGRFSTELFERYQRSERALVAALAVALRRARSGARLSRPIHPPSQTAAWSASTSAA
jgi:Transposase, Mutator family